MSFNIQQIMLMPTKYTYIFSVVVDTSYSTDFSINYKGRMNVNFGDNTKERLSSSIKTTHIHKYNS